MTERFFGKEGFIWWKGVVEDRKDPIFLGRVKVRIFGWHTEDKGVLPTADLPWALPSLPIDNGRNPVGFKEGDWCWGFFLDGGEAQRPVVIGYIPGIDETAADPNSGFYDPTGEEELANVPRPPRMTTDRDGDTLGGDVVETTPRFGDTNMLPGTNLAFGELAETFDITKSKFDVDKNGEYNEDDAALLMEQANTKNGFFDGYSTIIPGIAASSYPLIDRLNEPSTSRLSRNEKIEETIVGLKKQKLVPIEGAGFSGNTLGAAEVAPTSFVEPMTPYAAQYPYNHVYESESGHVLEVDDTPNAERLHRYHRSGTFNEIHPDGTEVNRVVKSQYNVVYGDYFNSTENSFHVDAKQAVKLKAATGFNIQTSAALNQQVGSDLNTTVGQNSTAHIGGNSGERVTGNSTSVTEGNKVESVSGSDWISVAEGVYINSTGGPIKIKATGPIQLQSDVSIDLIAPIVNINHSGPGTTFNAAGIQAAGPITTNLITCLNIETARISTWLASVWATLTAVTANIQYANIPAGLFNGFGTIAPGAAPVIPSLNIPPVTVPGVPTPPNIVDSSAIDSENNSALEELLKTTIESSSGAPKYGFFIPNGVVGDVYKPVSDSNGNLVTLSASGANHELREAIPTGELETVLLKYEDPGGKISEWVVVRPVHEPGELIDQPKSTGMFEDGVRHLARWSKPGREYPKQMFWIVEGRPMLILDSAERHQCKFGPYNDKVG